MIPRVKRFTGDTLAAIFLGDIQKWNDPRLIADNPELASVDQLLKKLLIEPERLVELSALNVD